MTAPASAPQAVSGASALRRLGVPALTSVQRVLADRGGLFSSAVFYLLVSGVLSALWRAAADEHGGVAGYSAASLTWYVFAAEAAVCAIDLRLIEQVGADIAHGTVAVEMLRPLHVVAVRLAVEAGRSLGRLAVLAGVGTVAAWLLVGPPPDPLRAPLAVVSLVLAVVANLAAQHVVAAASFWLRDVRATWFLWQKAVFILGGMLLPLEVLPDALLRVALWCPFMTMAYAPARLAAGHGGVALVGAQLLWLAVLVGLAVVVFARGQRRLEVVGG